MIESKGRKEVKKLKKENETLKKKEMAQKEWWDVAKDRKRQKSQKKTKRNLGKEKREREGKGQKEKVSKKSRQKEKKKDKKGGNSTLAPYLFGQPTTVWVDRDVIFANLQ